VSPVPLSEARQAVVHQRVLEAVAGLLAAGEDLTFARVARAAEVPERTVYRHFPTKEALYTAVFEWANTRLGFAGRRPATGAELAASVRRSFIGFDELAPVIRQLLVAPEGLWARLSANEDRQEAALALARREAPGLDDVSERRLAAALQLLTSAASWQTLRDYWQVDGAEAAETSALAIELLLEAARARAAGTPAPAPRHQPHHQPQ
jgi:AcrR family transcriptional regulator